MPEFNCNCAAGYATKTLAEMRQRMLIRLGYSQQLLDPPEGVVLKINDMLAEAQRQAYGEYEDFRTSRYYTFELLSGQRFYDFPNNMEECEKKMDPTRIEGVWIIDANGRWRELAYGIRPEMFTDPENQGLPYAYDIRQCIEVWPAPEGNDYRLAIKGNFGLLDFEADEDTTTIDVDVIFFGAMFMFKDDRGDNNAATYAGMQMNRIEQLRAAGHFTARYVPGEVVKDPLPQPIFLGLEP